MLNENKKMLIIIESFITNKKKYFAKKKKDKMQKSDKRKGKSNCETKLQNLVIKMTSSSLFENGNKGGKNF